MKAIETLAGADADLFRTAIAPHVRAVFGQVLTASEAIFEGAFVNVYADGADLKIRLADGTDPLKFACGFAPEAIADEAEGLAVFGGINPAVEVEDPAAEVWLSVTVPGGFQDSRPVDAGEIVQSLGPAIPGVGIAFSIQPYFPL